MVKPPVREPYNAKARQSTTGPRKKGKKRKTKAELTAESNPNAEILLPKSKEEKKKELLRELKVQSDSEWTSKKKRRLENYIEKKLKNEERVLLFEKLSQTQASMSSSLLHPSAGLGTGKPSGPTKSLQNADDFIMTTPLGKKRRRPQNPFDGDNILEKMEHQLLLNGHGTETAKTVVKASEALRPGSSLEPNTVGALPRQSDENVEFSRIRQCKRTSREWGMRMAAKPEFGMSYNSSNSSCGSVNNQATDETKGHDGDYRPNDEACASPNASDSEEVVEELELRAKRRKSLGFKHWALEQLNMARAVPANVQTSSEDISQFPNPKRRRKSDSSNRDMFRGPLGDTLELPATEFARQMMSEERRACSVVQVKRPPDVDETRIFLPIVAEQQSIMESIILNPVVIICGETGSGKTTQVPQFLYEAGFGTPGTDNPGMIGITQPRRVAAISMASRVAHELSLTSSHVSYQIRYDTTVSPSTSIKFMTDGVLLRELASDFLLTKYSVIIIDEAHERSINTDILIGVLSRVLKLREEMWKQKKDGIKPLRMIIMSATLRVSDFAENKTLFAFPPPVINVDARQHPVTIHFSRRTHADYTSQTINKIIKIHSQLPPGGILAFLTGRSEIEGVCKRLEANFGHKAIGRLQDQKRGFHPRNGVHVGVEDNFANLEPIVASQAPFEVEDVELGNFDGIESDHLYEKAQNLHLDSDEDEDQEQATIVDDNFDTPMHVVPLYSLLPSESQLRAFQPPPPHSRLVVVSTNIAETSLTIPGIRYVVDCGRAKERHYDVANGIQTFQISWISKASAAQRAGRAGRTAPGHCYRLYSSAVFEHHFDGFSEPEILKIPIEGVVLQMKSMHIDAVVNFPFPTPPDRQALYTAERTLTYLGALTASGPSSNGGQATELGRAMALFPLSPRFSRMLISSQQCDCLPYIICIVSALSVGDPFIHLDALEAVSDDEDSLSDLKNEESRQKEARRKARQSRHIHASLGKYTSDSFRILSVMGAYEYSGRSETFCLENFVRPKAMDDIHKLMMQITNIVLTNFPGIELNFKTLSPPNDRQLKAVRQIMTAGFLDQVAIRRDLLEERGSRTQYATPKGIPYRALGVTEDAYLHPSSVIMDSRPPDYLVFNDIVRTSRLFLKGLTVINPNWLSALGRDTLCSFSKPVKNDVGIMMTIPKFGPDGWELPAIKC